MYVVLVVHCLLRWIRPTFFSPSLPLAQSAVLLYSDECYVSIAPSKELETHDVEMAGNQLCRDPLRSLGVGEALMGYAIT